VLPLSTKNSACLDVDEEEDGEDENLVETKIVEEIAVFDEVMIWGHEASVDVTEDPYTKGMEEWISLAEAVSLSSSSA
jgi:ribonuclease H2 subunit C